MEIQDSPAVAVALAHVEAWSNHNWDKTKDLLAQNVHAVVASTQFKLGEYTGIDDYMKVKVKAAQLIEPGSVQILSTIGDESNALIMMIFKIAMGPGGAMVTMARTGLYSLDENKKIKEECDSFFILSE